MKPSRWLLHLLAFSACLAGGCTYHVRPTGYLDRYDGFNFADFPHVKIRSAATPEAAPAPDVILLRNVELARGLEGYRLYAEALRRRIYDRVLVQYRRSSIVLLEEKDLPLYETLGRRIVELRVAITAADPGSRRLRYWIGYGAGASFMQIEGKLVDLKARREACAFVVCDRNGGEPWVGFSPRGASDAFCFTQSLERLAQKLVWNIQPYL